MRALWGVCALVVLAICWWGPPGQLSHRAFFAHMTMHMGVVAVAAPLLTLAIAGAWLDPARKLPALFSPVPASVAELVVVWAWHAPGLHHFARHSALGLVAEQGMFLLCGVWVWLSAFGGQMPRSAGRTAAGVIGLLLTSMHMTLLGALLIFAPRPLYDHAAGVSDLAPLADQQLGGAIMLVVGGIAYLAGGLALTVSLLHDPYAPAKERTL
jgi:putative membrane protein